MSRALTAGLTVVYGRQELIKVRYSVVGARSRFRMVLDSEHRQLTMADPFDGPIIQVHVGNLEIRRSADTRLVTLHGEAVVLRSDQDSPGPHLFHGVVSPAMAIRKFFRRAAERQAEELMTEADAEHRRSA